MEKKYIYKITNIINGKSYIGQTKDYERRFKEHKRQIDNNSGRILYQAFNKYGIENFTFEILEEVENYNEREKYWIEYYNTFQNGYNMTPGGEEPPVKYGEKHQLASHKKDDVNQVYELLATTNKSFKEIASLTNYDDTTIARINKGLLWYDKTKTYPIRPEDTKEFKATRALNIINDLCNTDLSQKEIAEKYSVGRTTVTAINNGQNHRQPDLQYPIRSHNQSKKFQPVLMCDIKSKEIIKIFPTFQSVCEYLNINPKDEKFRIKLSTCGVIINNYFWIYKNIQN